VLRVLPVGAIPPRAGARVTSPSVADASVWRSRGAPAQPAHAADCFAREIIAILTVVVVRSRRLMGNPLGRFMYLLICPNLLLQFRHASDLHNYLDLSIQLSIMIDTMFSLGTLCNAHYRRLNTNGSLDSLSYRVVLCLLRLRPTALVIPSTDVTS